MANQALDTIEETQNRNRVVHSNRELREANQHMHEFLALLGHELRTPLAAIRNALRVLELKGEDAATREWARSIMERQTHCIGCLVEDMLEISRIEHGKIRLRMQPLDLAQTIARAIDTVRAAIEGHHHQLEVTLPPEPVVVDADPGRLEQVLTNLLNNAVKYMDPGGHIWVSAEEQGSNVVVRVRDSGMGIASEMLPHIFDPFWQLERTFEYSQNGLGIGLALVRKLAEMHGGTASAYSAGRGHGSEFVVCLPIHTMNLEDVV
jgi:signal transduction histidine kinase